MNLNNFYNGLEFESYQYLGAHVEKNGVVFRTYAPHAERVSVIGEFNGWTDTPMQQVENGEFWEVTLANAQPGQMYKYRIYRADGTSLDHADPYAFYSEKRPGTASRIFDMNRYHFHDSAWLQKRTDRRGEPVNIYEVHIGSWKRKDDPDELAKRLDAAKAEGKGIDVSDGWYTYSETADQLIPYLKENGFNYLEIMPLAEYPADESWGYQSTGFFSATSRYGTPDDLKYLVDKAHQAGIGVILDVVTVHFAANDYSLWQYDGTPVYEYPEAGNGVSEWGTRNFNHSKGDVRSFLSSASEFWIDEYHFDGLRFDAVGNLLYWQGDQSRGENEIAIHFLKNMNAGLKRRHPDVMLFAEDSSAYPGVTKSVNNGGIGFDYKWDMGWMNDTLNYFRTAPEYRAEAKNYYALTFSMQYYYNERYLLPLSHDEVVHGKATIMQKMYGLYGEKFQQGRAFYLYMMSHPGKKLNFMGNELGQLREWDERKQQDWLLLKYPMHDSYHRYVSDVNHLYLSHPAFWQEDYDRSGFEWIEADDLQQCVYVYRRRAAATAKGLGESIVFLFNFSNQPQTYHYTVGGPQTLELLVDSDEDKYSGETHAPAKTLSIPAAGKDITLPRYSARCYLET